MPEAATTRNAPWREFADAPLVPPALAVAVGVIIDRAWPIRPEISIAAAVIALVGWLFSKARFAVACAFGALAAAHHHASLHSFAADDISSFSSTDTIIAKVRGSIDEPPVSAQTRRTDFFGPARRVDRGSTVLVVNQIALGDGEWQPASGRVRITVERDQAINAPGLLDDLNIGDEIEIAGLLSSPSAPGNPGEVDYREILRQRRIGCELRVMKGADTVTRLARGPGSVRRLLVDLRRRLQEVLKETLPTEDVPLGQALLLGDTSTTERDDWDAFIRTGVLHVLAISGQHLVILAGALWLVLRVMFVPRRRGAMIVLFVIVLYAALTGGRPSAIRAAVMVGIICTATMLRRPAHLANAFALAWIVVVTVNPVEAVSFGSVLSFLSVFVLEWMKCKE